jgi:uncharacterized membrane protein YoaK (UPF0700 family)
MQAYNPAKKPRHRGPSVNWLVPVLLSTAAGAADVIGFLALGGLFTAHVTGNLCALAAHHATGAFSKIGPLLSVPVFVAVLNLITLFSRTIARLGLPALRTLLAIEVVLLAVFLALGVSFGPFSEADSSMAVLAGMFGVAAMATQNATGVLAIKHAPSTTVMTTNIVQLTVDVASIIRGGSQTVELANTRRRASLTGACIAGFVAGCAAGAFLDFKFGLSALTLPSVLVVFAVASASAESV